jgi:phytoene dehydrogenase-like protein
MEQSFDYDAIVVGSGPNGLAAAITLAREGCSVLLFEAKETIGGGMRTAELTLPGFRHDICSAVHPLGVGSPFFRDLPLDQYGVSWIQPDLPLAHPFADGTAAILARSLEETAAALGEDGEAYRRLMTPFVNDWMELMESFLGPLRPLRYPLTMARFGLKALPSAQWLAEQTFKSEKGRALFAGLAGHAMMPLDQMTTAAFGLMLGVLGHAVGWPLPKGGSQCLADALAAYLRSLGGEIVTGHEVRSLVELPSSRVILLDIAPRQLLAIAGNLLPRRYRKQLEEYRYGMGVFKMDWALDGPVPWAAEACRQAGTVHLGPTLEEINESERQVWSGQHPERPYTLVVQQSLFDPSRAPAGKYTLWAYCHVPSGSTKDMTAQIEGQIERFAPGFRDRILARSTMTTLEYEAYNPNYVGGDINCGVQDWRQLFTRPVPRANPYTTPLKHLFLCSSATPPGGGVHGMCGYHAARTALKRSL